MTPQALEALEACILASVPGFEICYKDESRLMRALGFVVCPFNQRFMTEYTTTWGSKVYFPSKAFYTDAPDQRFITLAHEFVHLWDSRASGLRFWLTYGAPQLYALIPITLYALAFGVWPLLAFLASYLLACAAARASVTLGWLLIGVGALVSLVLAVVLTGWGTLLFLGGIGLLGPWSSKGRTAWELRGYGMNMAIYTWLRDTAVDRMVAESISEQFTGPSYWYMCRDGEAVQRELRSIGSDALARTLVDEPYGIVYQLLVREGIVRHH